MPVDVATGVHYTAWEDVEIEGQYALIWRRYYSTALLGSALSVQGRGWRHSFDITLRRQGTQYLFRGPDGADLTFDDRDHALDTVGFLVNPHQYELRRERARLCVYHWHDWESEVHKFVFAPSATGVSRLERVEHPSGHGVGLKYDGAGRLVEVRQDIEQRAVLLAYTPRDTISTLHVNSHAGPHELICAFQYDDRGRLTGVVDGTGVPHAYGYDDHDLLVLEQPRGGGAFSMKYDSGGRCVELTGEKRYGFRRLSYNEPAKVTIVTDSFGHRTTYQLNERGQVVAEGLPNGAITRREFDEVGRLAAEIGPMGQRREFTYDLHGNLTETTFPNGGVQRIAYDGEHLPTAVADADGATWVLENDRGALVAVVDPLGRRLSYVRDTRNLIVEIRTPAGNRIAVRRNETWTEESYTDGLGLIVRWVFDHRLRVVAIYGARGLRRTLRYDVQSRLSAAIEADGSQEEFIRDASGQLVRYVDPNGGVLRIEYTPYWAYASITNPNDAVYRMSTDTEGRVTAITGPTGDRATIAYDEVGNPTRVAYFDGRIESYAYDTLGRCVSKEKSDGTVLRYRYAATERITKVMSGDTELVANTYDVCDQLLETITPTATVTRAYDACGRMVLDRQNDVPVTITIGTHGFVETVSRGRASIDGLRFGYDVRGRLVSLGTLTASKERFEYDAADLLLRRGLERATESFEYDSRERVTQQVVTKVAGNEIIKRRFEYDRDSNLVLESDALRGDVHYTYGPSGLLLRSDHSVRGTTHYEYDLAGNILRRGDETFEYEYGNRLVRAGGMALERDPNGNRAVARSAMGVTRYEWDALDQLTAILHADGSRTEYEYDGLGRRTAKNHAGVETRYYWGGDNLLGTRTEGETRDYAIAEFSPTAMWENGVIRHVISSCRGMPYELLDDEAAIVWVGDYDDWGAVLKSAAGAPGPGLGMPGQQLDSESGLHYTRFRYYDPAATRFVSPDPIGLIGGFNGFLYAPNAISWCDPLGLSCGRKRCSNSVYVLKKNGKIVYVGITNRDPKTRAGEHGRGTAKIPKKDFDEMVVIKKDLTRRQARNIEGSALLNIQEGKGLNSDGTKIGTLDNKERTAQPGTYYHSYDQDTSGPGRQVFTPAQTNAQLQKQEGAPIPNPQRP